MSCRKQFSGSKHNLTVVRKSMRLFSYNFKARKKIKTIALLVLIPQRLSATLCYQTKWVSMVGASYSLVKTSWRAKSIYRPCRLSGVKWRTRLQRSSWTAGTLVTRSDGTQFSDQTLPKMETMVAEAKARLPSPRKDSIDFDK